MTTESLLATVELIARQREVQYELDRWLGGPTREYHRKADACLDVIDRSAFWLRELERWRQRELSAF